jgi:ABC-type transporter Mla maintaining outer membrane lipid asymmetry permease subunit MlaE
MSTTRYATLLGLALGAVLAFTDLLGLLYAGAAAAIGYVVALILEGRINVDIGGFGSDEPAREPERQSTVR